MRLLDGILGFAFTYLIILYGLPKAYEISKREALFKINRGLSSSVNFTQKLTCKKLDSKMRAVPIKNCQ